MPYLNKGFHPFHLLSITLLDICYHLWLKLTLVVPVTRRTADQTGICYRDVCKEELFLPLTEAYRGEPRDKAVALSLFLIFLSLVTFAVTKPWG